jgi:NADH:ubiquinone oxidoreductase subunit H
MPFIFNSIIRLVLCSLFISFVFILVRITFCRFRYDMLIITSWKILLPVSLLLFLCSVFLFLYDFSKDSPPSKNR